MGEASERPRSRLGAERSEAPRGCEFVKIFVTLEVGDFSPLAGAKSPKWCQVTFTFY